MAKQDSTPKETSGGGFLFETEVVAYVLAHLLARISPFNPPGGGIERIDVQRPASEWHYDDLLVTVRAGGTRHRLAFSIKSNRQVTPTGFPPVLIRHGWEQILQHSSDVFDETTDFLGLVTSPVGPSLKHEVYELLGMARDQEPGDLAFQVQLPNRANATRRKLHASARCPAELENESADLETNPGRLLRRLLWSPFDFEEENSQRRAEAQGICRDLLLSGSTEEASELWGALKEIARRLRRHGGGMGLHRLVEELRGRFELRTFPDYRRDWQRLDDETRSAIVRARSTIGGRVSLPRKVVHEAISELFRDRRTVVLVGASGTGKSVIAKIEAEGTMTNGKALWLDSGRISARTLTGWRGHLNLDHAMPEVISSTTASDALLVLDGLDQIFDENSLATAAEFVKACRVGESASPWRLLITCTEEAWPRVRDDLVSRGVPLPKDQPMLLGLPEESELNEVWTSFPRLGTLRGRRHLTPVLLRPKVLDLLATHSSQGDDLALMGESHVARLLWERLITKGPHAVVRGQVVRHLARWLADELRSDISESALAALLGSVDLGAVDELIQDRVLVRVEGHLSFDHDLYGDWVRARELRDLAESGQLPEFLDDRIDSPIWHRALRLLGIDLLEQSEDLAPWTRAFQSVGTIEGHSGAVAQDVLLEAAAVASGHGTGLLHKDLWSLLAKERGQLLARLLKRALQVATAPDELLREFAGQVAPDLDLHLAAYFRRPAGPYWHGILTLLYEHREEIPAGARAPAARAADLWLRSTPPTGPVRAEAAAIAVTLGDAILQHKEERGALYVDSEPYRLVYRAVLAAGHEEPERVTQIVLEAAGRREKRWAPPPLSGEELAERRKSRPVPAGVMSLPRGPKRDPWHRGPAFRVDRALQEAVLNTDAFVPRATSLPEVAREALLALLISEPRHSSTHDERYRLDLGLAWLRGWYPPFYTRGPFLSFLWIDEAPAVTAILQFVEHATDRWGEAVTRQIGREKECPSEDVEPPTVAVEVEGEMQDFIGDSEVFGWSWHPPNHGESVGSALIALEKYLYDRADAGEDLAPVLRRLLKESRSLAIAGVLSTFGCRHPRYCVGPLRGLVGSPELLWWSHSMSVSPAADTSWGIAEDLVPTKELFRAWHAMPHRTVSLVQVAALLFINDHDVRSYLIQLRDRLLAGLRPGGPYEGRSFIESLAAQLDLNNYEEVKGEDGEVYMQFVVPEELKRKQEEAVARSATKMRVFVLPMKCSELLSVTDPLESGALDQLWAEAQHIEELDPEAVPGIAPPANSLAAVAAVITLRGGNWRLHHPERTEWARKVVLEALREDRDDDFLGGARRWDRRTFAAQSIPAIWAEKPDDSEIREAVARLACHGHYEAVEQLAIGVAHVRGRLPEDHQRLLRSILLRAALVPRLRQAEQVSFFRPGEEEEARRREKARSLREDLLRIEEPLVDATLEPRVPTLEEVAPLPATPEDSAPRRHGRRFAPERSIDENLGAAAYAGIPNPTAVDREPWFEVWAAAARDLMAPLTQPDAEPSMDPDRTPGTLDMYLLARLAAVVADCADGERRSTLWKPMIEAGASAADWVSAFAREWTRYALHPGASSGIVLSWTEMIDSALGSPRWAGGPGGTYLDHQTSEMWRALLGFVHRSPEVWTAQLRPRIGELRGRFETWARAHLTDSDNARIFAQVLTFPAMADLVLDGLVWLHEAAKDPGDPIWGQSTRRGENEEAIVSLLNYAWTKVRDALRRTPTSLNAFRALLEILVSRQNDGALELAERVGTLR